MATKLSEHELDHDLAFERFQAALEAEPGRYPRGAAFLNAEAPHAREALLRNVREGRPVVLVFPDGEERIVESARPTEAALYYDIGMLASAFRGIAADAVARVRASEAVERVIERLRTRYSDRF